MPIFEEPQLNKNQKEAVEHGTGPLLIIAGAGTGKTTVVTERIKHLIAKEIAKPEEILALTFTEKASREMEERVDVAMPYGYTQMWISTFHSFCDRILRDEALQIGLDPKYRLMTEAEVVRFMRDKLFEFDLHYFRPLGNPTKFISALLQHFSRLNDEDITPTQYLDWAKKRQATSDKQEEVLENEKWLELAGAYTKYEELKIKEGFMDFSNLIANTLKLFRERPNVLEQYKKQFKYILVDEFQDTNIAQYQLIKLLAPSADKTCLTVVGDDSQSIYKFRGAAISNMLTFMDDYPQAKMVILTDNYRSTQAILDTSYNLIQKNNPDTLEVKLGISKNLKSFKGQGADPEFIYADRVENEAEQVAQKIVDLVKQEEREFKDFAVLVRANSHAEPFVRAFTRLGIPHQFLGPAKLFQQPEIKELIAYLKILYSQEDSTSFYKLLTMDALQIEAKDISSLATYARKYNLTLFEASDAVTHLPEEDQKKVISKISSEKIRKLLDLVSAQLKIVPTETAGQIAYNFLNEMGLLKMMLNPQTQEEIQKAYNLSKFFEKLKTYEAEHDDSSIFAVVDWIDLLSEVGESPLAADIDWQDENAVNILTVHSSKGLEFPVVFVVNLVAQRFPSTERREPIPIPEALIKEQLPSGNYHLQEERRLFYVATTRAKDRLYITAADFYGEGKREKKLSPFIFDALGEDILEKVQSGRTTEQLSILSFAPAQDVQVTKDINQTLPASSLQSSIAYLSYSQIETFKFCPLHYKLNYLLHITTPQTASLSFGDTLHKVMYEFHHNTQPETQKNPEEQLMELLDNHWIRLGYTSKNHEQEMKKRGQDYLKNYIKSNLYKPNNPPLLLEQKFKFPIDGCQITGTIDRVDIASNGIEIIDYKTTDFMNKDVPNEREMKKNLQLSLYALAATKPIHKVLGKKPEEITLSLYFFDLGIKVSTTRTQKELEDAEREIIDVKHQIETSDFACSKNFFCQNCEYSMFCDVNT